jgi:Pyruvate/2-oxoacid:ferredoxin oxidoreductase delta subunit
MSMKPEHARNDFRPSAEQLAQLPDISGNTINGLGETQPRRPTPIYWHNPATIPHGRLQAWYQAQPREAGHEAARIRAYNLSREPLPPVGQPLKPAPEDWTTAIKATALAAGADQVGIMQVDPERVFEGKEVGFRWIVIMVVPMVYERLSQAPSSTAAEEVLEKYGDGTEMARALACWVRERGWEAEAHCGPAAGSLLIIPHAVEAGLGELGKHGSMINAKHGANFRLAYVLTDAPLEADAPAPFGADDFCLNCRVCVDACPPDAIYETKQTVRGDNKWYVDFDRCVAFFNENETCAICLAVCPWSRPGIAPNLIEKMARRRALREATGSN